MGGPPPPPPAPGAPPPPPPPAVSSGGGDPQAELMNALKDPNLRARLKKRAPPPEKKVEPATPQLSPEELAMQQEAEKQELFIELLGFMEAPNGNIEELVEKIKTATSTCRTFVYTLVRRGWVEGSRVVEAVIPGAPKITVWPGREWMAALELKDVTEAELKEQSDSGGIVARVHMYRFDQILKQHTVDEIALNKTSKFPKAPPPFRDPEPPQDNSLENRKKWEDWNIRKQNYLQSDFPQFELIFQKLLSTDASVTSIYAQMVQTMDEMRRMGEALHSTFEGFSVRQLRKIVQSIPTRIRDVAKRLQQQSGIIIRDEGLKLTPEFLKNMNLSKDDEDGVAKNKEAAAAKMKEQEEKEEKAKAVVDEVLANPSGSLTMGGVPVNVLIPLLKKSYALSKEEQKLRRLTL